MFDDFHRLNPVAQLAVIVGVVTLGLAGLLAVGLLVVVTWYED